MLRRSCNKLSRCFHKFWVGFFGCCHVFNCKTMQNAHKATTARITPGAIILGRAGSICCRPRVALCSSEVSDDATLLRGCHSRWPPRTSHKFGPKKRREAHCFITVREDFAAERREYLRQKFATIILNSMVSTCEHRTFLFVTLICCSYLKNTAVSTVVGMIARLNAISGKSKRSNINYALFHK